MISLIPVEKIASVWEQAATFIQSAWDKSPGHYDAIDVLDRILQGYEALWGVFDDDLNMTAAFTTQIEQYPKGLVLMVRAAGGSDADGWIRDAMAILRDYAKDNDCKRMEAFGRAGWWTYAKQLGGRRAGVIYDFNLED